MNKIQVLDCTLRDGGYCNDWNFGFDNIKKIILGLIEANVEIIECGFLTKKSDANQDKTKFMSVDDIANVIPQNRNGKLFVAMMNFGEFDVDELPDFDGHSIDGIRVAYHKKDRFEALSICKTIRDKGYLVFVQAMVSLSYSDDEFLDTIRRVNSFHPYAFYIVDSFGMMKEKDLIRLFYMVEHNLDPEISIGFHSHNNMQLAYSNAQRLVNVQTNRRIIIDSTVFGMGRGAGNLNTELFVEYLNENSGKNYSLKPVLVLIDEIINGFYQQNYWGYSLPNYISAAHNAHPNYAGYLDDKKTLTIEGMNDIFDLMDEDKKVTFDKKYIEELYLRYMNSGKAQEEHKNDLIGRLKNKSVLLVAPGKSSIDQKTTIIDFASKNDVVIISVNYVYEECTVDYVFLSNLRRFRELKTEYKKKSIVTSNISADEVYLQTKYRDLLNDVEAVSDNAGLMAVKFLIEYGVSKVFLAGFDGYSHDVRENYGKREMAYITRNAVLDAMNLGMSKVLKEYCKFIDIEMLTTPKHVLI